MSNLLKDKYPEIFSEIDIEKTKENFPNLSVDDITYGSAHFIYFKCSKCKNTYKSRLQDRTIKKYGCPYCSNKQVLPGFNDLQTRFPDIAKEWDYERNYPVLPSQVLPGTHKKYWWICPKCGNSYKMQVNLRSGRHSKCPFCTSRKPLINSNTLEAKYPGIYSRINVDLTKKAYPHINLREIMPNSKLKIYWNCDNGHVYKSSVYARIQRKVNFCPYCSNKKLLPGYNDLESYVKNHLEYQYILDEWDYKKNSVKINEIFPHANIKVWFICPNGHSYKSVLANRLNPLISSNCPYCSYHKSVPELTIYNIIKDYIDPQALSGSKINKYEIDIFSPKYNLCVEYDGKHYHNSEESQIRENNKNMHILKDNNYKFIRIKETNDVDKLNKFKEILDSGLVIYYVNTYYNINNFKQLSNIFKDIFGISIDQSIIKKYYFNIKNKFFHKS